MKTLQRVLCVMLSIIMAMSCLSVAAFAEGEEKFTSTIKAHSTMSNKETAKVTLDELDKLLAEADIYEEIVLTEGVIGDGIKLVIDLRSVNALCNTIDDYKGIITIASKFMGDLKELDLSSWEKGLKRTGDDITILSKLIELIASNRGLIEKLCSGNIDLGLLNDFISVNDLLGPDGVSGMIRKMIVGIVHKEGTAEFTKAYNDIDSFIYNDLIASFTEDFLPGLKIDSASTIESLLIDVYNISFDKYIKGALQGLNVDLSASDIPELKALAPYLNLKGSTYDLSGLTLVKGTAYKEQLNDLIGKYIKLIVPSATWENGGYDKLSANIEKTIKDVASQSGIIKNADKKTIEQIGVEIALIILKNGDFGAYEEGLADCDSLEDMVSALLINTANEMKIGVDYDGSEGYLEVAGDIFAYWAYDSFNITDTNGKVYRAGGGKDVFEVANYFINYFLFDRGAASALGLSTTKTETVFTKFDKLADFFGQNKAVNFNSKNFILGTSAKKGLLDCILTLDIGALLDLTVVAALDDAGTVSAVEFIYKSVQYFLNNWAGGKKLFPDYKANAFANALSNTSIATMVSVLLDTVNSRRASVITLATFAAALAMKASEKTDYAITSATIADMVATGKALAPKATVKAGGKTLTQGTDYMVLVKATAPGTYTATIKGTGIYEGEIERSFKVVMGNVSSVSYTSTTSTVKLSWAKVPYASGYKISQYDAGTKKYKEIKTVTGTSYTVEKLSAGKEYKFTVQAVNPSYNTTTAKAVTAYTVPSAVKSSAVKTSSTPSSVKLTWSAVSGATHYKVEKYASKKWSTVNTVTGTSLTVSGLSGYTSYSFRITALKKLPDGTYLAAAPVTVKAKTTLGTPSSLEASYTTTSITLSWTKVSNAAKYQVQQYTGGKWKTIATVSGTSYKVTGLKAATKYKLAVRAMVKEGSKWIYGDRKEITQYSGLSKPSKVKVSSTTTTTAKLSWSKVSKAESYEVYAYIGGKWVKKGTTKKTSITIKELSAGKKTKFKVRAVAKLGGKTVKSPFSGEVTALTLVGQVKGLDTSLRKTTSISLKWKKTTGATSYQVYRYTGGKWKKIATTSKTSYTDSKSLKKGTEYKYKVRAVQKVSSKTTRYGAYSSVLKAKTTRIGSSRF